MFAAPARERGSKVFSDSLFRFQRPPREGLPPLCCHVIQFAPPFRHPGDPEMPSARPPNIPGEAAEDGWNFQCHPAQE